MRIDHVILGARTLAPLGELLWERYGFGVTDGSPNPDGTASWVVPFDTPDVQYLELLVVDDESRLRGTEFGDSFLERTSSGPVLLNWAALVDDMDVVAREITALGEEPDLITGESVRADGQRVPWAEAAFLASWRSRVLPFFLQYGNSDERAGRVAGDVKAAGHRVCPLAITGLVLGDGVRDWPGFDRMPLSREPGEGIRAVRVATADGELEVRL